MFAPRNDQPRTAAIRALKAGLSADRDRGPLLRAGSEPRQVKIHKPAVDVTEDDLRHAIEHGHTHAPS